MASTANNKHFHTYENVGYDDQHVIITNTNNNIDSQVCAPLSASLSAIISTNNTTSSSIPVVPTTAALAVQSNGTNSTNGNNSSNNLNHIHFNNGFAQTTMITSTSVASPSFGGSIAINKSGIESPFIDPVFGGSIASSGVAMPGGCELSTITPFVVAGATAKVLSATNTTGSLVAAMAATVAGANTESTGTARMLTSSSASTRSGTSGQNLVTKLITFPSQSPMDSLREWSLSTFKCTKQLINEKRGLCPITNDSQLQNDIEKLRENRDKLVHMLKFGQQMTSQYTQLVRTQKQLHTLMNEMSMKCFTDINSNSNNSNQTSSISGTYKQSSSKQVIAKFSSLSNNLSSTTTTHSPTRGLHHHKFHNTIDQYDDLQPIFNHLKTFNDTNLVDDFKKNAITLNVAIKNGEKLIVALDFYCSNLSTLINKTIEDTLLTVKQYESARLEYDAERNSLSLISPSVQSSMTYSSDKVEVARLRYEHLKEDVQIKLKFLEENVVKVMHKQLMLFNGAFASYTSGSTAALDQTLKQFSIKDG